MKKRGLERCVVLLAVSLFLLGRDLGATTTFSELEADVFLSCGGNAMCEAWELSTGDFDGDGFVDLLYPSEAGYGSGPDYVVFGDYLPDGGSVPSFRTARIGAVVTGTLASTNIGDITGDGRADVFHFRESGAICDVTLGRPSPPTVIPSPANFAISGGAVLNQDATAFGDVNGDGLKDLLFCWGTAYVVFGSTSFQTFSSTLSVSDTTHVLKITGGDMRGVASGDVDGDGIDDIVISDPKAATTRTQPGVVYVIRGSTSLPSVWNLATSSASWTIIGDGVETLDINFAADFTGDGKADLGLERHNAPVLLSGADLLSKGPVCILTPGHANSLTPSSFPDLGSYVRHWKTPRDFDGDGRPDLCAEKIIDLPQEEIYLFLSHSLPAGSALPEVYPPANLRFTNVGYEMVLGDLNGDGKNDLIYKSETFPRLNVFYGFWPLENPRLVVQPRQSNQARVHLTLSVEGEPAEMKLTGNILDPAPGVWIPFQSKVDVTMTPEEGEKTITAVFRTSGKRESDSVSAAVPLALGEAGSSVVTNLLREGGTARFEARLDTAGRLKASVYSREGRLLRTLIDDDMSAGVHVIEWDGTNGEGARVAPGIYTVVVDRGGSIDRRRVLVK